MDTIEHLEYAVRAMKERRSMSYELAHVRSISESDLDTLKRLVRERTEIASLLERLGVKHDDFDYNYSNSDPAHELEKCLFPRDTKTELVRAVIAAVAANNFKMAKELVSKLGNL